MNFKSIVKIFRTFSPLAVTQLLISSFVLAEPGNESLLKSNVFTVTVYLTEVHRDPKGRIDVSVVWIPEDILERCLGKPLKYCSQLDNCMSFPDAQDCTADYKSCTPIIREECIPFGFTLENVAKRKPRVIPYNLLSTTPYEQSSEFSSLISKWGFLIVPDSKKQIEKLERKYSVKAEVMLEEWTNGENFKVLRIWDKE